MRPCGDSIPPDRVLAFSDLESMEEFVALFPQFDFEQVPAQRPCVRGLSFKSRVRTPTTMCRHHIGVAPSHDRYRGIRLGHYAWAPWKNVVRAINRQLKHEFEEAFLVGILYEDCWYEAGIAKEKTAAGVPDLVQRTRCAVCI